MVKYLRYRVLRLAASPYAVATGFACGVAMSFTPLIGLHFVIAAIIAFPLRGSVIAAALGTLVGNPLTFPLMWGCSYHMGLFMLGRGGLFAGDATSGFGDALTNMSAETLMTNLGDITLPWLLGSMVVGPIFAMIAFVIVRFAVAQYRERRPAELKARFLARRAAREEAKHEAAAAKASDAIQAPGAAE
ncbi:MAG: DUF2062 domain-containing protein [Alphaproteobacteria bacterium]|nr:DUF2062 domain-containing protein [Alphaproteobacteria bacterium SS10]